MIKKLDSFVLYLETEDHQKYELLKSKSSPMQILKWMSSISSDLAGSNTPKKSTTNTSKSILVPLMMQKFKYSFPVLNGMRSFGVTRVSSYMESYEYRDYVASSTISAQASDPLGQLILKNEK